MTTLRLIGRIQSQDLAELEKEIRATRTGRLCLREVSLVDIDVVRFLAAWKEKGLSIVNRAAYIREWMDRDQQQKD